MVVVSRLSLAKRNPDVTGAESTEDVRYEVQSAVDDSVRCCGECQPGSDRGYEVR